MSSIFLSVTSHCLFFDGYKRKLIAISHLLQAMEGAAMAVVALEAEALDEGEVVRCLLTKCNSKF